MKTIPRPLLLVPIFALSCALFAAGLYRLQIDTDVVNAMPTADPVIRETAAIFKAHPIQDQVLIDLSLSTPDSRELIRCAAEAEALLKKTGLFSQVGTENWQEAFPELIHILSTNLPYLFTAEQLAEKVAPRLTSEAIERRMADTMQALLSLEGIGHAALIENDPLGLSEIAAARLAQTAPAGGARLIKGRVVSADGTHLLLPAKPAGSATDTATARKIEAAVKDISARLNARLASEGQQLTVTPVGAFRSALDNERLIRKDVEAALLLSAAGIALLLVLAFSRPLLGLLAMLPAAAGAMCALFVYSLFNDAISAMVLGFGGAVISITVDHGIAYLLFLDGANPKTGRSASEEVRAVGLLAALTSIGAFAALTLTGFPAFRQLGLFAALGIGISFLFVHAVFPAVFPAAPAARTPRRLLQTAADGLARLGPAGAVAALILAVGFAFHARPGFDVSLTSMNTVSSQTRSAEALFSRVWGSIFDRIFVMTEADDLPALRTKMDSLYLEMQPDLRNGVLASGFVASAIFPGPLLAERNRSAWRAFWTPDRIATLMGRVSSIGAAHGFAPDAFAPFSRQLQAASAPGAGLELPPAFFDLAGISHRPDSGKWVQVSTLTTGPVYDGASFRQRYRNLGLIFDPAYFSKRLGTLLFSSFTKLLAVIGASVVVLLLFFYLDVALTAVSLLPIAFALVCTLGTLNLLGRPIDIPGLMLSIVVVGMGIDYSLFFVRSFQRYGSLDHPSFSRIRLAVFMAGASTLIGFGVLCFSRHTLLKSAGVTSFLGIAYAMIGAFLILPPVLTLLHRHRQQPPPPSDVGLTDRVRWRYRNLEAYPRLFARFKQRFDPMFAELPDLLPETAPIRTILDVGTGFGVPGCWLLERYPEARLWGIEPDGSRMQAAARAMGDRAVLVVGAAPDLPALTVPADLAVMLDMIHYLGDAALTRTLGRIREMLASDGTLLIRAAVPPERRYAFLWHAENLRLRIQNATGYHRRALQIEEMIEACGFRIEHSRFSGSPRGELIWWKVRPAIPPGREPR
ncbi:MAG: MMPL family transporter [Desulfobacterales bacterium]|jgi:predicted exporter